MKAITSVLSLALLAVTPAWAQSVPVAQPIAHAAKPKKTLDYLDPALFDPARLLPAPPARGSKREAQEIATLRALIASASPARLKQAKWDGDHENPSAFDAVMGRDLAKLPATWALLKLVQREASIAAGMGKDYFHRLRPFAIAPGLPHCGPDIDEIHDTPAQRATGLYHSYPSGHATLGYSVGYVLAQLVPEKAPEILARASDYALSRQYCGVHFPSDTEASHVLGTLAAVQLLADPRLATKIAAARAELARP